MNIQLIPVNLSRPGGGGGSVCAAAKDIGGIKFAARQVDDVPAKELKGMVDEIKNQLGSGVVALVGVADGKVSLVVGVTSDLTDRLDAVALVRAGSKKVGGKGGGRADFAQAGGIDVSALDQALESVAGWVAEQLD